jgi:hypothetical protein
MKVVGLQLCLAVGDTTFLALPRGHLPEFGLLRDDFWLRFSRPEQTES